jgi:hypothetical protein
MKSLFLFYYVVIAIEGKLKVVPILPKIVLF